LCIKITFLPGRDVVFIPLKRLTGEWCFVFWKVITLCPEIIQKHKNSLCQKGAFSNWFHCIGSKMLHLPEQPYMRFFVARLRAKAIEPQYYYPFPVIVALDSTAEILPQPWM
jgi:hypothetical protein